MPVWVYRWKYWSLGSQLLPTSTNRTTLSNDATTVGFERQYLDELFELIKQNDLTWLTMARQLDIRYLLLRNDFYYDLDWLPNTQPFVYQDILDNSPNVEKIKTALTKPMLTVFLSDTETKDIENPFHIKPEGKVFKSTEILIDSEDESE